MNAKPMLPTGTIVKMINQGSTYSSWDVMAKELGATSSWISGRLPNNGDSFIVIGCKPHPTYPSSITMYLIQQFENGNEYLVDNNALELIKEGVMKVEDVTAMIINQLRDSYGL